MHSTTLTFESFRRDGRIYLTDGGFETSLIFHEGLDLPAFAACTRLDDAEGRAAMRRYFDGYLGIAETEKTGFVLDTATWRSGVHWAGAVGRDPQDMLRLSREAVQFALLIRERWANRVHPILVNGVVGPAGDGYRPEEMLDPGTAQTMHGPQIQIMAESGIDMVTAVTMTHPGEAIGIVRAAAAEGLPVVISFTTETDGRLPDGTDLGDAIRTVDAETGATPHFYMVNCAHPDHFADALGGDWLARIGGVRANASRMSHAELDAAEELDDGDPEEFGRLHGLLSRRLPNLRVLGGCCGTDHRHVGCAASCVRARQAA